MGRHLSKYYKSNHIDFKKITVEIEKDLYNKLLDIRFDYFDRRSFKEIINNSLRQYLERS